MFYHTNKILQTHKKTRIKINLFTACDSRRLVYHIERVREVLNRAVD